MYPWRKIVWNILELLGLLALMTGLFALAGVIVLAGQAPLWVAALVGVVLGWGGFAYLLWHLDNEERKRDLR